MVVVGKRGEGPTDALLRTIMETSLPTRVLLVIAPGTELPANHPAFGKGQEDGKATVYVCRGTFCSLPATENETLVQTLSAMRRGG